MSLSLRAPRSRYGYTAQAFHWLVAIGIIVAFVMGWIMTDIRGITLTKLKYFNWHKWLGVTVFGLAVLRIVWRLIVPAPPLPASLSVMQKRASLVMHYSLYVATLAVPLVGYLYTLAVGYPVVYFGLVELPVLFAKTPAWIEPLKLAHAWLSYAMAVAVVLHTAAALMHHFHYRDDVLQRMLPRFRSQGD